MGQIFIILLTDNTSSTYIEYLKERKYDYIISGKENIDYCKAVESLAGKYGSKTILSDSGGILNSILLEHGLVSEISIIISLVLVGRNGTSLFRSLNLPLGLRLKLKKMRPLMTNWCFLFMKY